MKCETADDTSRLVEYPYQTVPLPQCHRVIAARSRGRPVVVIRSLVFVQDLDQDLDKI